MIARHSLGGALATLAAEDIGEMKEDISKRDKISTWNKTRLTVYT